MTEVDVASAIRSVPSDKYGDDYQAHVLEMWKVYLGMADNISDRRERANAFFITLHTGAIAVIGFLVEKQMYTWAATVSLLAGVPFSFLWYRLIRSYRDLNTAKFKVVHEVEKLLPLKLFDGEWEAVGRGEDPKRYLPFTHIEIYVPVVLLVLHILIVIGCLLFQFPPWPNPS